MKISKIRNTKLNNLKEFKNRPAHTLKKDFYSNIDKYMKNTINKNEYLDSFLNTVNKIVKTKQGKNFNSHEKKYIDDMLITIDLADKIEKISNKYIKESIKRLLELREKAKSNK